MIKDDLQNYIAAKGGFGDVSDPQVKAYLEAARMMVLSADGKHIWDNLKRKSTLDLSANVSTYTFPSDGSDDPLCSKLVYLKKQGETNAPMKIYTDEEAAETEFTEELSGAIIYPTDQPGQISIVFKLIPTSAQTLDVGYRIMPGDGLDFVKPESHDLFLFACDIIIPIKGVSMGEAFAIRRGNYQIYQDRLQAAIANDYTATQENMRTIPPLPTRQLQDTLNDFQGDRE